MRDKARQKILNERDDKEKQNSELHMHIILFLITVCMSIGIFIVAYILYFIMSFLI